MKRIVRIFGTAVLAAAFVAPMTIVAAGTAPQVSISVRVYDRRHKDYHDWDDRERRAWTIYLRDNHRREVEYEHARRRDQDRYWEWRHKHHDRD